MKRFFKESIQNYYFYNDGEDMTYSMCDIVNYFSSCDWIREWYL